MDRNSCVVTIQNIHEPHVRESRVYNTYELARKYLYDQANIHEIKWDGSDRLIAGNKIITITTQYLYDKGYDKYHRETCGCTLF